MATGSAVRPRAPSYDPTMPLADFTDATAVVTGSAGGLGLSLAHGLASAGARVALIDRNPEVAAKAHALPDARGYVADVGDAAAMHDLAHRVATDLGPARLLIANAGVAASGPFEDVPMEDVAWVWRTNVEGTWNACHAFLPQLRAHAPAHAVIVSSAFAFLAPPGKSAYAASKAAVRALAESLRAELQGSGVGVTLLVPGPLDTGIVRASRAVDPAQREAEARLVARRAVPLERVVRRTLRAVRRDEARALVGVDAHLLDLAARAWPAGAGWMMARAARRLPLGGPQKP
jgi:NAD(P)-dependent dehydrogenase (short-subunit alcohol dehydrogenase family)